MIAPCVPHLRDVPHPSEDPVGDARRSPRAGRDLLRRIVGNLDPEDPCGAADDRRELAGVVVAEPEGHPEAVAERCRQETRARRRPDEGERREIERERPRGGALAEHDVEPEVLERRVQDLLCRAVETVDLVDEQHVSGLQRREDRCDVLLLQRGPRDRAETDAQLLAHDLRECRLPQPGRAGEQHVVERVVTRPRRLESDPQLLLDPLLSDEVVESARPERLLGLVFLGPQRRREELRARCGRPAECQPHALLGREIGVDLGESPLGVDHRVAELDERVARDDVAGCVPDRGEARLRDCADLLLELEHDALRGLLADPGDRLEAGMVAERDRLSELAAGEPETTASATFGPMPLTVRRCTKSSRSSASANPYSWRASSRTWRYVSTVTSAPGLARRRTSGVAATR